MRIGRVNRKRILTVLALLVMAGCVGDIDSATSPPPELPHGKPLQVIKAAPGNPDGVVSWTLYSVGSGVSIYGLDQGGTPRAVMNSSHFEGPGSVLVEMQVTYPRAATHRMEFDLARNALRYVDDVDSEIFNRYWMPFAADARSTLKQEAGIPYTQSCSWCQTKSAFCVLESAGAAAACFPDPLNLVCAGAVAAAADCWQGFNTECSPDPCASQPYCQTPCGPGWTCGYLPGSAVPTCIPDGGGGGGGGSSCGFVDDCSSGTCIPSYIGPC